MRYRTWLVLLFAIGGCHDAIADEACEGFDRYNLYSCTFVAANCEDDCDAAAECRGEVGGTGCGYALQLWVDCEADANGGCDLGGECRPEQQAFEDCLGGGD